MTEKLDIPIIDTNIEHLIAYVHIQYIVLRWQSFESRLRLVNPLEFVTVDNSHQCKVLSGQEPIPARVTHTRDSCCTPLPLGLHRAGITPSAIPACNSISCCHSCKYWSKRCMYRGIVEWTKYRQCKIFH